MHRTPRPIAAAATLALVTMATLTACAQQATPDALEPAVDPIVDVTAEPAPAATSEPTQEPEGAPWEQFEVGEAMPQNVCDELNATNEMAHAYQMTTTDECILLVYGEDAPQNVLDDVEASVQGSDPDFFTETIAEIAERTGGMVDIQTLNYNTRWGDWFASVRVDGAGTREQEQAQIEEWVASWDGVGPKRAYVTY